MRSPVPGPSGPSQPMTRSNAAWWAAAAAVLLALAIGNYPLLLGQAAPQWDAADFFGPSFSLVSDETHAGHLLKWDPWVGGGVPEWLEPELGATSPVTLAFSLLPLSPSHGYELYWMCVWAFGGIGMLLLSRHLGAPAWGALIAAVGFVASGFYTGHAEHMSSIYSVSFLPWIVWRLDAALLNRDWWSVVQAGLFFGLSGLGGYPAYTIMTSGLLLLWAAGRVLTQDLEGEGKRSDPAFAAAALLMIGVVGALVFAPPYAGALRDTQGFSDRVGPRSRPEAISSNLLPVGAVSTLASPYLALLNSAPRPMWPQTDISMTSVYAGSISLVLAVFALWRRSGWRWWLAAVGGFALLCAFGSQLPLRGWLYDFVPPTRYFRNPALFRAYSIFVVSILAAMATRDLRRSAQAGRTRLLLVALLLAGAAAATFYEVNALAQKPLPELPFARSIFWVVWMGMLALAFLWRAEWLATDSFLRLLALLACLDAVGALHTSRPTLYTSATVPWWQEMDNRHRDLSAAGDSVAWPRELHPPDSLAAYPNNRNVALKILVFDSYITWTNRFHQRMLADPELSKMALGANRAWFSNAVVWRWPDNASFDAFRQRVHDHGAEPILVVHSRQQMLALAKEDTPEPLHPESTEVPSVPPAVPAAVSDLRYEPDSLSLRYTAPEHGYLLVTDRWATGWEATVNGQARQVLGGDFVFRVVEVDAGMNEIEFHYNPRGFWPLLGLSWGTLALGGGWQIRRWTASARSAPVKSRQTASA